jgi:hypothetical protein
MSNVADPFDTAGWKFRMERAYTPLRLLPPDAPRRPPFKGGLGQVTGGWVPAPLLVSLVATGFFPLLPSSVPLRVTVAPEPRLAPRGCEATAFMRPYLISRRPKPALLLSFPDTSPDYHRRSDVDLAYFLAR